MTFVIAAWSEHVPRKGGIHNHEEMFASEKERFDGID
jgi:hypothetical protein